MGFELLGTVEWYAGFAAGVILGLVVGLITGKYSEH